MLAAEHHVRLTRADWQEHFPSFPVKTIERWLTRAERAGLVHSVLAQRGKWLRLNLSVLAAMFRSVQCQTPRGMYQ